VPRTAADVSAAAPEAQGLPKAAQQSVQDPIRVPAPSPSALEGPCSDVAFTQAVKAVQSRKHSRQGFLRMEARGGFEREVTSELLDFLAQVDSAYLATASAAGQPYVQHRGGPKGFIRLVDERTLGFADYAGNRQYVTTGNLSENDRAFLFLMDYAHRRRVKLWGQARVVEDDAALLKRLVPQGYPARPEQAILFRVSAWDVNCPQHIPQKLDAKDVGAALETLRAQVATLEADNAQLRADVARLHRGGLP
jgi:uncharacterized protein